MKTPRPNPRAVRARIRGLRPATVAIRERTHMLADGALRVCPVPGCGRPPAAKEGKGLSRVYCRRCTQRASRSGCPWKGTYTAAALAPFRKAARKFVRANRHDYWINHALNALGILLDTSGGVERIVDTYEMHPRDKARTALARMRQREIPPERLLVDWLAVAAAVATDPIGPGSKERAYRRIQAAKACARKAASKSGAHAHRHNQEKYARSTGLFLVYLGKMLEECCEHVQGYHLAAIISSAEGSYVVYR